MRERLPGPRLSTHIECYWWLPLTAQSPGVLPPQGTFELLFVPAPVTLVSGDGASAICRHLTPGCWLMGQTTRCFHWQSELPVCLFGVRLKPFALFATPGISPRELKEAVVPLNELGQTPELAGLAVINDCRHADQQWRLADALLWQLFNRAPDLPQFFRRQTNLILAHRGNVSIAQVCRQLAISKVTLRRHFLAHCGLLPKELCIIWRLNHLLWLRQQHPMVSLTALALQAGYYDQPHFNREFRRYFHQSPATYFRQSSPQQEAVLGNIRNRFQGRYDPRDG